MVEGVPRCWGFMSNGRLCDRCSTHCVRGEGFHMWTCERHLAQVADAVQKVNGESSIVIAAFSWQKGH